ncbi:MAG: hypothetical protein EZS28_008314 [Streblomastix strix]|uniref:Uncharacterized protein n=1 Tax=Streblomastix strix TaxID=222440 RepID=A0A5J4WM47_9EUKA|nr:MAG: hypothetical protein EZS28_008314 [Streblomastix strix]
MKEQTQLIHSPQTQTSVIETNKKNKKLFHKPPRLFLRFVAELRGHTMRPLHVALSVDGRDIISYSADGSIRRWMIFVKGPVEVPISQGLGINRGPGLLDGLVRPNTSLLLQTSSKQLADIVVSADNEEMRDRYMNRDRIRQWGKDNTSIQTNIQMRRKTQHSQHTLAQRLNIHQFQGSQLDANENINDIEMGALSSIEENGKEEDTENITNIIQSKTPIQLQDDRINIPHFTPTAALSRISTSIPLGPTRTDFSFAPVISIQQHGQNGNNINYDYQSHNSNSSMNKNLSTTSNSRDVDFDEDLKALLDAEQIGQSSNSKQRRDFTSGITNISNKSIDSNIGLGLGRGIGWNTNRNQRNLPGLGELVVAPLR